MLLYKPWRRRVDQRRMRNATFEPLSEEASPEAGGEDVDEMDRKADRPKAVDVSVEPIEATDAAGPVEASSSGR